MPPPPQLMPRCLAGIMAKQKSPDMSRSELPWENYRGSGYTPK